MKRGLGWYVDWIVDGTDDSGHVYGTRRHKAKIEKSFWPVGGSGNFVELTLRIVVKAATGTLMAFQPEYPHGTTCICGAHNQVCAITFSSHILEAYKVAMAGNKVDPGFGAGDNDGSMSF